MFIVKLFRNWNIIWGLSDSDNIVIQILNSEFQNNFIFIFLSSLYDLLHDPVEQQTTTASFCFIVCSYIDLQHASFCLETLEEIPVHFTPNKVVFPFNGLSHCSKSTSGPNAVIFPFYLLRQKKELQTDTHNPEGPFRCLEIRHIFS